MKLLWALALLLIGLAPADWSTAGDTGSLDPLCGLDTRLATAPPAPTAADPVQVIAAGEWTDACVPGYEAHEVAGGVIRIDATVPSIGACSTVITPWEFAVEAGRLAPGSYQVQLYLSGPFGQPERLCAKADLVVRPAVAWRVFFPLMSKTELVLRAAGGPSSRPASSGDPGRES